MPAQAGSSVAVTYTPNPPPSTLLEAIVQAIYPRTRRVGTVAGATTQLRKEIETGSWMSIALLLTATGERMRTRDTASNGRGKGPRCGSKELQLHGSAVGRGDLSPRHPLARSMSAPRPPSPPTDTL
jgi:hypothetical protein